MQDALAASASSVQRSGVRTSGFVVVGPVVAVVNAQRFPSPVVKSRSDFRRASDSTGRPPQAPAA